MPSLKSNPTLKDFQEYVLELEKERSFDSQNVQDKCLLLGEEVGELFKSIRKYHTSLKVDENSKVDDAASELADILIYLLSISNRLDVDLEQAFRDKEEINKKRKWA